MPGRNRQNLWIGLCCFLVAISLNFGALRGGDQADSWVSTLTSLVDFTPYAWGSNRFGTLSAILAMPFRDPVVNHFVQDGLTVTAMLGTAFLLGALKARVETAAWACTALWGLLLVAGDGQWEWLTSYSQPYALSIFLGLLGWRWGLREVRLGLATAGAFLCFLVSLWVNISLGPWLAVAITANQPKDRRSWLLAVLTGISFVLNLALASQHRFKVSFQFGMSQDPLENSIDLAEHFLTAVRWQGLAIWLLASLLTLAYVRRQDLTDDCRRIGLAFGLASGIHWVVLSRSAWIEANAANPRYLTPVLWSLIIVTSLPLARALGSRKISWLGLALFSLLRFGAASPESWVARWTAPDSPVLDTLERRKVSVLVGNYWSSWRRTFFAYIRAYRGGKPPWLWACSQRSENTRDRWEPQLLSGKTIAFDLKDEAFAFGWLGVIYVPLVGKTFVPEYFDENFVIGHYGDEAPVQAYTTYEPLPPGLTCDLRQASAWKYLGQGWGGPALDGAGRLVGSHQADLRFQARPGQDLQLVVDLAAVAGPQPYAAFLNGEGLTQGVLQPDVQQTIALNLPSRLVKEHNVVSLTFPEARLGSERYQLRSVTVFQICLKAKL